MPTLMLNDQPIGRLTEMTTCNADGQLYREHTTFYDMSGEHIRGGVLTWDRGDGYGTMTVTTWIESEMDGSSGPPRAAVTVHTFGPHATPGGLAEAHLAAVAEMRRRLAGDGGAEETA